ncbi:MAG: hypothetical protein QME66_11085 [Candidatus Eisenbacteria bacterium]|nr:hypothetical protein [Candidatus Eisenbacteria bacterium]
MGKGKSRFSVILEKIGKGKVKGIEGIDGIGFRLDGGIVMSESELSNAFRFHIKSKPYYERLPPGIKRQFQQMQRPRREG